MTYGNLKITNGVKLKHKTKNQMMFLKKEVVINVVYIIIDLLYFLEEFMK